MSVDLVRRMLQEHRKQLLRGIVVLSVHLEPGVAYHDTPAEDASAVEEQAKAAALKGNLEAILAKVEYALARIEAGTYGICEVCHRPIDPARLECLPEATRCYLCASRR